MRKSALLVVKKLGAISLLTVEAWATVACGVDNGVDSPRTAPKDSGTGNHGGGGSSMPSVGGGAVSGPSEAGASGVGGGADTNVAGSGGTGGSDGSGGGSAGSGGGDGANVAGSGGAGGSIPPPPSICDGTGTRMLAATDAKIDDFEAATISPNWSSFNDVMPVPNAFSIAQVQTDGAATTWKSARYRGTGAKTLPEGGYGVGTVFNIAINKAKGQYCVDISAFDGVSFWAKAAKEGADVELNFVIPETNATKDGGDCTSGCYNHPRTALTLTTGWKQYTVTFASAGQGAYDLTNRIQELAWLAPLDADWDFSIDEIAFYKGTAPAGPVSGAR
jgi:hypothetical protein